MEVTAKTTATAQQPSLSQVVPLLLRGVLYREEDQRGWQQLAELQAAVRDYVAVLGLELYFDEAEGYAFLRTQPDSPERLSAPPRLVARRQLSFPVSLLLALLRKKLLEFDAGGNDSKLVMTRDEVAEMMRVFMPAGSNDARFVDQVETHLNKVGELGFVRKLRGSQSGGEQAYEVRRIIKAFVDAEWLKELDERLADYRRHLAEENDGGEEDHVPG